MKANTLSPVIVAFIKDSSLSLFLDKWQDQDDLLTFIDVKNIFSENDLFRFEKSPIVIKKEFSLFSLPELYCMIEQAYIEFEKLAKNVLRATGRSNDGPEIQKIEW
jgi:hypothetical protein